MATATIPSSPAWQAEVTWQPRYVPQTEEAPEGETEEAPEAEATVTFLKLWDCYVEVFRPGGARIRFRVNRREGRRLSFTDPRDARAGTAGTTGLWGTRPAPRAAQPGSLTPTAFRLELTRLIGAERATEILRTLLA